MLKYSYYPFESMLEDLQSRELGILKEIPESRYIENYGDTADQKQMTGEYW